MNGAHPRSGLTSEYVSTDCPTGQITLTLASDGGFTLALAIWDPVVRDHVGWRTLTGRWSATGSRLELAARARSLTYGMEPMEPGSRPAGDDGQPIQALRWRRSSLPTFADGFTLVASRRGQLLT